MNISAGHLSQRCEQLSLNDATLASVNGKVNAIVVALGLNFLQILLAIAILTYLNKSPRALRALAPLKEQEKGGSLADWFRKVYSSSVEDNISIDGQVVIRLCVVGFKFSTAGSLVACGLIPFYYFADGNAEGVFVFTISNLTGTSHDRMFWPVVVAGYVLTALFMQVVRAEWRNFIRIRQRYFLQRARGELGPSAAQAQHSLLLERVPHRMQSEEAVQLFFSRIFQHIHSVWIQRDTVALHQIKALKGTSASICGKCSCLQRRVDKQVDRIVKLQRAIAHQGRQLGQTMEGLVMDGDAQGVPRKLGECFDARLALGQQSTSTAFLTLQSATEKLISDQAVLFRAGDQNGEDVSTEEWVILPGPESRDIIWSNIGIPLTEVKRRILLGSFICAWGVLVWSVPVAGIQALASEPQLKERFPNVVRWMTKYLPVIYSTIVGYLPVLALMGLLTLLPYALEFLAKRFEGRKTRTEVALSVLFRNFFFQFFTLWVTVFSSSILSSVQQIIESPKCASQILGVAIPQGAVYFITFVIARIGISLPLLLFPIPSLFSILKGSKPEAIYCAFGTEVTNVAIVFALGSMYCLVAPIIMPICMVYFGLAYGVYKWLFENVYASEFDSGGVMWKFIFLEIMLGMIFSVVSLFGMTHVYGQNDEFSIYASLALPLILLVFGVDCYFRLGHLADSMPYEDAMMLDSDMTCAEVRSNFSISYYEDPILAENIEDLIEDIDSHYFPEAPDSADSSDTSSE